MNRSARTLDARGRTAVRVGTTLASAVAAALLGTGAHAAPDPPVPSTAVPPALAMVTCGHNGTENQWMTRSNAVTRARSWIGRTPYSMERCYRNAYGDYRTDCSGMVAMAWGLGGRGNDWWTGNLHLVSTPITAAQLQPGDALLYHDGTSSGSHVALFVRWADQARTNPVVVQETGSAGNTIEGVPTNFNWRNYTPIRYDRILDDAATSVSSDGRAVRKANGHVEVFGVGVGGSLWRVNPYAEGWTDFAAQVAGNPVSVVKPNGHVETYVRSTSNTLLRVNPYAEGWTDLGGSIAEDPTAVVNSSGQVELYVRGGAGASTGSLWRVRPASNEWTDLGNSITGSPNAVLKPNGHVEVYMRSAGNRLLRVNPYAEGWTDFGGELGGNPASVVNGNGHVEIYMRGATGRLLRVNPSAEGWTDFGSAIVGTPSPARKPNGQVETYVRTSTNNLMRVNPYAEGWTDFRAEVGGDPTAIVNRNGHVEAFVRAPNGNLMRVNPYAEGWTNLGNNLRA